VLSHRRTNVLLVTKTQVSLPDEDRLDLPESWARGLLTSEHAEPDPAAPALWREQIEKRRDAIDLALGLPQNAPYADAIRAYLGGEPDPLGAILVMYLAQETWLRDKIRSVAVDAWQLEQGLGFAAAALVEEGGLMFGTHRVPSQGTEKRALIITFETSNRYALAESDQKATARLRGALAASGDTEYRAARDLVAKHRTGRGQRGRAALLFPNEDAWVTETCAETELWNGATRGDTWVLIRTAEQLAALPSPAIWPTLVSSASLGALIAGLGADSLPAFTATLENSWELKTGLRRTVLAAIGMLPGDDAMRWLVDHLAEPYVPAAAASAARRYPVRALRTAISTAATDESTRRLRTGMLAEIDADVFDAALERLGETERAAVRDLMRRPGALPEADPATLPRLLVDPPWASPAPKAKPVVVKGLTAPEETTVEWLPGEQERFLTAGSEHYADESDWPVWEEDAHKKPWNATIVLAYGPLASGRALIANPEWKLGLHYRVQGIPRILARFEADAVPAILNASKYQTQVRELLLPVVNVTVARLMAEWYVRLATGRALAVTWLERHAAAAARLLVPDALGKRGTARENATAALRYVAARRGGAVVLDAAAEYGPAAVAAVRPIAEADPLEPIVDLPALSAWANPALLPQVRTADGEAALPDSAVRHLARILAVAGPTYEYEGVEVAAAACDRDSLREFSHALFTSWLNAGALSKDGWALDQLSHFGDDATVRLLTPHIREWPGQSQHKRAVTGLGVLGRIGSEGALRAMQSISERAKFGGIKAEAARQIAVIAGALGLTSEQLADRLVPDFGLGEQAALVLDYGPRRFTVAFDEHLKPYVADEDGKARKSLPKPGAKDDPALAEPAYRRFADLKKELRTVAVDQVRRLDAAMVNGRTWNREEFERFFVGHALMRHLAARLVWEAESGSERFGFRIAEDGTFGNAADEAVELAEDVSIRLAHPARMAPAEREAWFQILADYEMLQPFEQLTRPVVAFTEEELATGDLKRFEGFVVEPGSILGMTKHGWGRAAPADAGGEPGIHYALPGGGYVIVALSPGLSIGMGADSERQELRQVYLSHVESYWRRHRTGHPTEIDAVAAAEVLASLERLTATA